MPTSPTNKYIINLCVCVCACATDSAAQYSVSANADTHAHINIQEPFCFSLQKQIESCLSCKRRPLADTSLDKTVALAPRVWLS